jgi:hypothetical protein
VPANLSNANGYRLLEMGYGCENWPR